jgi:hypothetical protein
VFINDLLSTVIKFKMTKTQQVLAAKFHPHIMCPHIYNLSLPNPCLLTQTAANTSVNSYDKHKKNTSVVVTAHYIHTIKQGIKFRHNTF